MHPYQKYVGTLIWNSVSLAIDNLIANQDMEEKTSQDYLVGYIITELDKQGCINEESLKKKM